MGRATTRSRTLLLSLVFATAPALGKADGQKDHGWWVGWVEKDGKATAFAMLVRGEEAFGPLARRLTEVQLRKRGLLAP
ncbi:MAG TPA: hypothetical protein VE359_12750 [Vicinamibacteria bacterium]|nr:hypothetical protein [Vicinamibacteria bacterium]